ncbi:MAG TPA: hypothetical protein VHF05_01810 [Candidatus Paceibacterota bacterium]|jgi:hypothetical protein|nr:hypothetical protein [Candidatus Paceibacterota bacterium]
MIGYTENTRSVDNIVTALFVVEDSPIRIIDRWGLNQQIDDHSPIYWIDFDGNEHITTPAEFKNFVSKYGLAVQTCLTANYGRDPENRIILTDASINLLYVIKNET